MIHRVARAKPPATRRARARTFCVRERRESGVRINQRIDGVTDGIGLVVRHTEVIDARQIGDGAVRENGNEFRHDSRLLTGLEERGRKRQAVRLHSEVAIARQIVKLEADGARTVGDSEAEEIRQRGTGARGEIERHAVGQRDDRRNGEGDIEFLRQHGVAHHAGIAFDHGDIPQARRERHGRRIRQDINVFIRVGRIEAAVIRADERGQWCAFADDQIRVVAQVQKLEGRRVSVRGDVEDEILRRVICVQQATDRHAVAQRRDVEIHADDRRGGVSSRIPHTEMIRLAGHQRRHTGWQRSQGRYAGASGRAGQQGVITRT